MFPSSKNAGTVTFEGWGSRGVSMRRTSKSEEGESTYTAPLIMRVTLWIFA